jgi:opacity protein-like surface antigen
MNTIKLSTVALLLTSTFALAGGDFIAVEPVIETPEVVVAPEKTGFYAGLAYSCMQFNSDTPDEEVMGNGISVQAGYNFNQFIGVEARYTTSLGDPTYTKWNQEKDIDGGALSNIAIYLKPQYSFGLVGVYGLLGYGQATLDNGDDTIDEAGLQYGAGITASVNESVEVFVDYRRLYDDTGFDAEYRNSDVALNSWSIGANYKF